GIDAPAIHGSSNQVVPVARARVSLRLAPGDDAVAASDKLIAFLKSAAPWGVEVTIEGGSFDAGQGYMVDTSVPALLAAREALEAAYGSDVMETGSGGSIPLVPLLADTFPGIAVLMWGAMDERSNIHSVNESVDLGELEHMALAEALFIWKLAEDA
ncbi:MAG: dipeptidase, partial [Actinomycetota bacterium]